MKRAKRFQPETIDLSPRYYQVNTDEKIKFTRYPAKSDLRRLGFSFTGMSRLVRPAKWQWMFASQITRTGAINEGIRREKVCSKSWAILSNCKPCWTSSTLLTVSYSSSVGVSIEGKRAHRKVRLIVVTWGKLSTCQICVSFIWRSLQTFRNNATLYRRTVS